MFSLKFPDTKHCGDAVECAYLLQGHYGDECMLFVKEILDTKNTAPQFHGTPNQVRPNAYVPEVGSIILLNEGLYGHTGVVFAVGVGNLTVIESNGDGKNRKITLETYSEKDRRIRGYIRLKI